MDLKKEFKLNTKNIFTIPNILSYIRIILIVPFVILFIKENYLWAAVCLIASALSDCVDGFLARKLNQITKLGKMLDPIADKLTLLAVGVCICVAEYMVIPVVLILIVKDILMITGASIMLKKGVMPCASEWYGKVGTVCFYTSVTAIVVFDLILKIPHFNIVSFVLLTVTAIIMIYSLFRYSQIFKESIKQANKKEDSENTEDK